MNRVLSMMLCAVLLVSAMVSCSGPNLSGISGDELRTYTAMKSENFEISGSMYAYFFYEIGTAFVSTITQEELDERKFDENKTLKEQKYDKDRSWYDYVNEYVAEEVTKLLLTCEAATEAGITLTNEDYAYVNDQLTGQRTKVVIHYQTDYNSYLSDRYAGLVNEDDVTKVFLMETLAAKYNSQLTQLMNDRMTQERVDAHIATMNFENGKDETITRNLGHILASYTLYDEDQAYENVKTAKTRLEATDKSESAFEPIWKELSDDANMIYRNLRKGEMVAEIDNWIYAEERKVGDIGIISTESGYHLLYYISEGDPVYVAQAKDELVEIISKEILEEMRAKYKIVKKKNVMNVVDV